MSDKRLTAVETLVIYLNEIIDYIPISKWEKIRIAVEQAKQMEREQIEKAYDKGADDMDDGYALEPSDYFTKNYGDEKEK